MKNQNSGSSKLFNQSQLYRSGCLICSFSFGLQQQTSLQDVIASRSSGMKETFMFLEIKFGWLANDSSKVWITLRNGLSTTRLIFGNSLPMVRVKFWHWEIPAGVSFEFRRSGSFDLMSSFTWVRYSGFVRSFCWYLERS
jgi:hypothetical protein